MRAHACGFKSGLGTEIERYIQHKRALARRFRSEEAALRLLDRYLVEHEVRRIDAITGDVLEAFLASRPRHWPRSYNHLLGVVRGLFDWLAAQGIIDRSPLQTRPRRQTVQRLPFLFDLALAHRLLDLAEGLPDRPRGPLRGPTYRTAFALMYGLGLRVGEVARLRRGDVDLERRLLVIRQTKFSKDRLVPFGPRMAEALRRFIAQREARVGHLEPQAPFFSFDGRHSPHPYTFTQTFHRLVSMLDLVIPPGTRAPRAHHLRHSFAVGTLLRWYRQGARPMERLHHLSTFLGHVDPVSTSVYLTVTAELLEEANHRFEHLAAHVLQGGSP